jgi:hypothetical protein
MRLTELIIAEPLQKRRVLVSSKRTREGGVVAV